MVTLYISFMVAISVVPCRTYVDELLASTSILLDHLLNISEQLLREWAEEQLVEAVCEAAHQLR